MNISSLPLLRISPPGAVISVNFCMRFGCEVGGCGCVVGCVVGAGTTAGPPRRAGDVLTAVVVPMGGMADSAVVPGDCTVGVLTLPALVRAIVLTCGAFAAPLPLAYVKTPLSFHISHIGKI